MRSRLGAHFFVEFYILWQEFCIVIYLTKCYYILTYGNSGNLHTLWEGEVHHCG